MRIYVINLARATERRRTMQQQAEAMGRRFDFLDAIDGLALSDAQRGKVDHHRRKQITPYPLSDNEIGCWLSHQKAMQALLDSGEKMATIIEDDALLSEDFPKVIDALARIDVAFDVVDLHRKFKKTEIFLPCHPLVEGCALGRIGYSHMGMIGYVMSRAGAQKFLDSVQRFAHAVDKEMHRYWANGLNIYGLEKPVATHEDGGNSYIDETRGQDRPAERVRYPDADRIYWRLQRLRTQLSDSIQKRIAFQAYRREVRKQNLSL